MRHECIHQLWMKTKTKRCGNGASDFESTAIPFILYFETRTVNVGSGDPPPFSG